MNILSKTQIVAVVATLGALWAIHNIDALSGVKDFLNFDQ